MGKLFGTDGVRGTANIYPMNADIALKLGMAAAKIFKNGNKRTKIVIGKDTRVSGYMIEYAITAGIVSMGVDVLLVGPMPTPAIAHLTKSFAADAGIVISASHNPAKDNGIKFFDTYGNKLSEELEKEMEELVFKNEFEVQEVTGEKIGKAKRIDDAQGRYIEFAKASIMNMSLKGKKIILDTANGAAYKIAPPIFEELGAEVIVLNDTPDGMNINKNAGSLHPELMINKVLSEGADLGIALDGDADRIILIDEKGEVVDGDEIMAIYANYRNERNLLKNKVVVGTVMSNLGLELGLKKLGINFVRTPVGDKHVAQKLRELKSLIGGEQSGHIIFSKYSTTGDGIISGLQMLRIMKKSFKTLSELKSIITKLPQTLINTKVREKIPIETIPGVVETIKEVENELGEEGRVLVRYSGTENKCRVMLEGKNKEQIETLANKIVDKINEEIGE